MLHDIRDSWASLDVRDAFQMYCHNLPNATRPWGCPHLVSGTLPNALEYTKIWVTQGTEFPPRRTHSHITQNAIQ